MIGMSTSHDAFVECSASSTQAMDGLKVARSSAGAAHHVGRFFTRAFPTMPTPLSAVASSTTPPPPTPALAEVLARYSPAYVERYRTMRQTFLPLAGYLKGRHVLDFGCGKGLSAAVMVELGAAHVTGVDVFAGNVDGGTEALSATGYGGRIELHCVEDTRRLPLPSGGFETIVCNAVLEHIPQPRDAYIREVWRLVKPGGVAIINETPNKYLPMDFHTLHLPLTNWLPSKVAHRIGVMTGRFRADRTNWEYSGWRGAGHYELLRAIPKHERRVIPELANARHRVLNRLGLPSDLFDPYPLLIVEKRCDSVH
jgi:2-polyprenyl-3-methyl-5-hydroxy-6-metoxy-1,4-benzoquinol methylase